MSVWNNSGSRPQWNGSGINNVKAKNLTVSTLTADQVNANYVSTNYVQARSLSTLNAEIGFLSNLVINTGVIGLGIGPTFLTANDGILYVNGDAVAFPSSLSTIADWSFFTAVSDVNLGRSSIYNVKSISTNVISTGTLLTRSISTANLAADIGVFNNISSGNILYDTLNGRAGTIRTLSGSNLVYTNGVISNLTSVTANTNSFIANNIVASNLLRVPSISTIIVSSFLVEANTLYGQSTATGFITAQSAQLSTMISYNSLIENINGVRTLNLSPIDNYTFWDSNRLYLPNQTLYHNTYFYSAILSNRNTEPGVEIQYWDSNRFYYTGETGYIQGVGAYIAKANNQFPDSPNNHPDQWDYVGPLRSDVYYWLAIPSPTIYSGTITGNNNSYIQIGNVSTISLNASSINVANVTINNLNVNTINSSNIINNNFSNAGDAQLNTLTTAGEVNTNNVLNVNGLLALQSDVYGQTQQVPIIVPPFSITQYLRSLYNIKNVNCEAINVVGGATGNFAFDYRNNSIVNIGETELSPGIVTINGINAELTTALTVNGITSLNGDTTIFGLNTVNGFTDLNGDLTVIGLTTITGDTDIIGLTSITGNTDINGACEITGETNILGTLTAEAGIIGVGALGFTGGDITIGGEPATSPANNFNFYNYYRNTNVEALTVNKNGDFRQDVGVAGDLNVGGIIFGTVISGQESISTLNVSTLRAFNISSITNTTQEFFVSSIAGYSNRIIEFNNSIVVPSISTNNISTGSITLGNIVTNNISTTTLNFINGTGNQLILKSDGLQVPVLGFSRTIDDVNFLDGVMASSEETGLIVSAFSTFTVSAFNDISIGSAENVIIKAENAVNISTNFFVVDNAAGISSIYTNYIQSKLIELYTQDIETPPAVVFYRDIDGERVGDGSITTTNEDGFTIGTASTLKVVSLDDMFIRSLNGNIGIASDNSNIVIAAPSSITLAASDTIIPYNLTASSIATNIIYSDTLIAYNGIGTANVNTSNLNAVTISTGSIYTNSATIVNDLSANNLFTTNLLTYFIGNPLPFQSPVTFNDNLNISGNDIYNTATLSASNISTTFLSTGSLLCGLDITTPAISTTTISTSVLFTSSINAPVNINFGKSIIPFSGNNLDIGASGAFRWRNLWVSTISSIHTQTSTLTATNTISASTIAIDRIVGNASATNVFTNNLFPISAGAQLGYNSGGTAGGGFYNILAARSTFTQVINPSGEAGRFSNAVYINTNLSTQNVMVSSINNKLYPYTSTLNIPYSSFSITGNQAGTPILLYSNIDFRTQGFHRISQKAILSKNSGGASADIHGNIFYTVGAFPSTPSITDGYSALPLVNQDNASTFTTLLTEFYVSTPTTRNILYYDATANNYSARLYMGTLFDSVMPDFGNNATRIPGIL